MSKFIWGPHHNYPVKFVPCVHLNFLIFEPSKLMSTRTMNLILMSYNFLKKKNQSHIFNKNHHITIRSILLKIRKKMIIYSIKFR